MKPPAVVLLSGGLGSATCLAIALRDGFSPVGLAVDYGQRHRTELQAAAHIALAAGVELNIVRVDLRSFGGSALTADIDVPKSRSAESMGADIPITYVPARNLIFLSLAAAQAEVLGARSIFIGVNQLDYSGYPDCRQAFIDAFQAAANLATRAGTEGNRLTIEHPLIDLTKAEIIALGTSLGVDYAMTTSCYDPSPEGLACGSCDACQLRRTGFEQAKIPDPTHYADRAR